MTRRAWMYVWAVLLAGVAVSWRALPGVAQSDAQWSTFAFLTLLATLAQLFKAEAPKHQLYYATRVFQFAGVLLLHPFLFVLLQVISHLIEWAKERLVNSPHLRAWYLQPFNISVHILAGLSAQWVYARLDPGGAMFVTAWSMLAAGAAALTYVVLNHILVGLALVLGRNVSLRESGVFDGELLLPDLINLLLGYIVAVLWTINPWLILPALSPLVLIYRALMIPQLKRDAQTDSKTGLWNARHFTELFTAELDRAQRFGRPLAFIMADLDLLRNINNTYGHLTGDAVLVGISDNIRQNVRDYDFAGRFGGEEFAIALPETGPSEAYAIAERIRQSIELCPFEVPTSSKPLQVTMSLGIACYPQDATAANDLVHQADIAVYQAKLKGRNLVVCASDVPHSVRLEAGPPDDRAVAAYAAAFQPRPAAVAAGDSRGQEDIAHPQKQSGERAVPEPGPAESFARRHPKAYFWLYVYGTILAGAVLALAGTLVEPAPPLAMIALLAGLAAVAELLQIDLYAAGSVSVSVAVAFAAALIGGFTGMIFISAAIALLHYLQRRPPLYKTAFNWAVHMLAGAPAAMLVSVTGARLALSNLPLLALPVLVAAAAYYLIETGLIAAAVGLSEGTRISIVWRQRYRWLAGHYLVLCVIGLVLGLAAATLQMVGVLVFSLPVLMMRYAQKQYVERTEDSINELRRMNAELTQANREISGASRAFRQLNDELFLALSKIIDARDPYVGGHAAKVAEYGTAIATELKLPAEQIEAIRQAAYLHDIGKIGIAEHVLHKPSELTNEEYQYIQTHVTLGAEFLETCQGLRGLVPLIRHHHERWDGEGYPDGLRGEEIPLGARILSVCDAVEVMASDRPYRRAMSLDEIVAEVRRCAGTQFDPAVAEACLRMIEREGSQLITNSAHEVVRKYAREGLLMHYPGSWFTQADGRAGPGGL